MLRNAIRRASNRQFGLTPPPSKSFVCAFCQHTPSRLLSTSASRLDDTRKPESALSMTIKEMMDPKKPKKEPKEKKEKAQSKKSRAHTERLKEKKAKAKENSLPKSPKKSQKKEGIIRKIVSATSSLAQQKKETAHREAAMKTPDSKDKASPVPQRRQGFSKEKATGESIHAAMHPQGTDIIEQETGLCMKGMEIEPIPIENQPDVAILSHGLDRVLFNPGVVYLQDPRSRVFNFDPYLQQIMPVTEFDFDAIAEYITSSKDKTLENLMKEHNKKYMGSTSSMTSVLSHFHYLLSAWRPINVDSLSKAFTAEYTSFTSLSRLPTSIFLRYKGDGTYAIDSDKELDTENVLSFMGRSMEKCLTLPPDVFEKFRHGESHTLPEELRNSPETYHYSTFGDFMMRSQLDAHDPRLPGTGMFDLKTRAVVSIRIDVTNFQMGSGYQIKSRTGNWESFEREYFDMIRAAFLKYSMQVRIGRMDGIFVAFHNTEKVFGFQYISLAEMDAALHEGPGSGIADQEFKMSLTLLNKMLNQATKKFPEKSMRLHFETRETSVPYMYMFAEPMEEEEIEAIQKGERSSDKEFMERIKKKLIEARELKEASAKRAADEAAGIFHKYEAPKVEVEIKTEGLEAELVDLADGVTKDHVLEGGVLTGLEDGSKADILNSETSATDIIEAEIATMEAEDVASTESEAETTITESEADITADTIEANLVDSEIQLDEEMDVKFLKELQAQNESQKEIYGITLMTKNFVNGEPVLRPNFLEAEDKWEVEYSISEFPTRRAWSVYNALRVRKQKHLVNRMAMGESDDVGGYVRYIRGLSREGREFESEMAARDAAREKILFETRSKSA